MTSGVDATFLDTNVLVYASIPESPFHREAREAIGYLEADNIPLWISRQVLREYLATLIRPKVGIIRSDLIAQVQAFERRFRVAEDSSLVTAALLLLVSQGVSSHIHDTNIVATMLSYGIPRLLTNNITDFEAFQGQITVIPLQSSIV